MSKDAYVEANGIRLHYLAEGAGPLIIFLHGFPEYSGAWKEQLAEFGQDHLAVAPDMRGYNLSEKPAELEQYHINNLVEDVRALAEQLGHKRFTLVGHDWGGVVAWSFAIAHPECLDRLVIVNAPHPVIFRRELADNAAQQKASGYMQLLRSEEAEQTLSANNYAWLTGALFGGKLFGTDEDKRAYVEAWSQPGALTGGLNYYRAMRASEQRASSLQHRGARDGSPRAGSGGGRSFGPDPSSHVVKVLTLVIWGEKDTALLTGNLTGLEQFVPDLTVRRIPDGSHWVIHEHPALVNGYIREFLGSPLPAPQN
jgi:epoxide hydrolase 4